MHRLVRWVGMALAVLVVVAAIAAVTVYMLSERAINRTYPIPKVSLSLPADPAAIEEGRRQATIHGCLDACHGKSGEGKVMFDNPPIARVVAPNLPAAAARYDPSQLAAIIRHGVRPDGRSMVIMPSEAFVVMNDEDLSNVVAFLKSMPPSAGPEAVTSYGPLGRFGLASAKFRLVAQMIAESTPPPEAAGDEAKRGRYLGRSVCGGCHAPDLRGATTPEFTSTDLGLVATYSPEAFARLMKEGVALGDRQLPTMSGVARAHFSFFNEGEVKALYAYLHGLAAARK